MWLQKVKQKKIAKNESFNKCVRSNGLKLFSVCQEAVCQPVFEQNLSYTQKRYCWIKNSLSGLMIVSCLKKSLTLLDKIGYICSLLSPLLDDCVVIPSDYINNNLAFSYLLLVIDFLCKN